MQTDIVGAIEMMPRLISTPNAWPADDDPQWVEVTREQADAALKNIDYLNKTFRDCSAMERRYSARVETFGYVRGYGEGARFKLDRDFLARASK